MHSGKWSRPVTRKELPFLLFFALVGMAVSAFLCSNGYPVLRGLLCGVILYPFGVCLHELGHAWGAILMGGSVRHIQMGEWRKEKVPWRKHFLGFDWILYLPPFSGLVHSDLYTTRFYRIRRCFIIIAGPFMNIVLLLGGVAISYQSQSAIMSAISLGLTLTNASMLLASIPPRDFRFNGKMMANDGLLFYRTLRYKSEDIKRHVEASEIVRSFHRETAEASKLNLSELLAKDAARPNDLGLLWSIVHKLSVVNDRRYVDFLLKLIEHPHLRRTYIPVLIDNYLTWQLNQGPPDRPDVADQLSSRLLTTEDSISARGTRGSVLIDLGKIEEGRAMLEDVLVKTKSDLDKAYSHVFLALADKHEGTLEKARQHAKAASKLDVACPARARIADLMNVAPG